MEPQFRPPRRKRAADRGKTARCRKRTTDPDLLSDQKLELLVRDYLQDLQPTNEEEFAAVASMIRAHWLADCVRKFEKDRFDEKIRELRLDHPETSSNTLLTLAFIALADEGGVLDFISGVEDRLECDYADAVRRFARLREKVKNFQTE